jgi:hypothetical protein
MAGVVSQRAMIPKVIIPQPALRKAAAASGIDHQVSSIIGSIHRLDRSWTLLDDV